MSVGHRRVFKKKHFFQSLGVIEITTWKVPRFAGLRLWRLAGVAGNAPVSRNRECPRGADVAVGELDPYIHIAAVGGAGREAPWVRIADGRWATRGCGLGRARSGMRRSVTGWIRIGAVLSALALCGCGAEPGPDRPSRQDELRARLRLEPRVRLPLPQLAALTRHDSAGVDEYCDLAGGLVLAGEYAQAIDVYQQAVARYPDGARAHYRLGQVLARTGQYEEAIRHWQRTLELIPDFANAHFDLGVAFAQRAPTAVDQPANLSYADLDSAIAYCSRAVELEPTNAFFHHNLGRALQLRHESERAATAYRQALAIDDSLTDAHRYLGEICLEQARLEEARAAYKAVVGLDSSDAAGHYHLGKALERLEQYAAAARAYERSVGLAPHYRDAWYSLAKLCHRLGRTEDGDRALAQFEGLAEETELQAARLRVQRVPNGITQRRALAVAHAEAGQHDRAVEEFQVALALARGAERAAIHHDLGLVYDRMGDVGRALVSLQRAAGAAPETARFQLRLAQVYAKVGQDSLAAAAYERALGARPGWTQAQCELGMLHVKGRRPERAQALFAAALRTDPGLVQARFGLSLTYIDQQRYRDAAEALEAVLRQDPAYPGAAKVLANVRRQLAGAAD